QYNNVVDKDPIRSGCWGRSSRKRHLISLITSLCSRICLFCAGVIRPASSIAFTFFISVLDVILCMYCRYPLYSYQINEAILNLLSSPLGIGRIRGCATDAAPPCVRGAEDTRRTFDMLWIGIDAGGMASTRSTFSKSSLVQGRHLLHTFSLPTLPQPSLTPSLTPKCTLDKREHFLLKGYGRDDLIAT
ncbi:MAG: hypothetical protein J3Q66DRAFT_428304, partial [Benniella sp.]